MGTGRSRPDRHTEQRKKSRLPDCSGGSSHGRRDAPQPQPRTRTWRRCAHRRRGRRSTHHGRASSLRGAGRVVLGRVPRRAPPPGLQPARWWGSRRAARRWTGQTASPATRCLTGGCGASGWLAEPPPPPVGPSWPHRVDATKAYRTHAERGGGAASRGVYSPVMGTEEGGGGVGAQPSCGPETRCVLLAVAPEAQPSNRRTWVHGTLRGVGG